MLFRSVTDRPLTDCNFVEPLEGGDEAYPAMLEAIARAKRSVGIASYIFDNDPTGRFTFYYLDHRLPSAVHASAVDGIDDMTFMPNGMAPLATVSRAIGAAP